MSASNAGVYTLLGWHGAFRVIEITHFLVILFRDERLADIDRHMQSALAPVSSDIIKACLPGGQEKPFPYNSFSLMVLTGGKGSMVNHSQVRFPRADLKAGLNEPGKIKFEEMKNRLRTN